MKFKWLQRDLSSQPLSSQTNTQTFSQISLGRVFVCELSGWEFEYRCSNHILVIAPLTSNNIALFGVTLDDKTWTFSREVFRGLKYCKATKTADIVEHFCSQENYVRKCQVRKFLFGTNLIDWQKELRKSDYSINEEGRYKLLLTSQQPKTKNLWGTAVAWCFWQ